MLDSPKPASSSTKEPLERLGEILQECLDGREQDYPSKILLAGHDFQLERRPITGGWDSGMWCTRCGSRMNQAPGVCPGRKPNAS